MSVELSVEYTYEAETEFYAGYALTGNVDPAKNLRTESYLRF